MVTISPLLQLHEVGKIPVKVKRHEGEKKNFQHHRELKKRAKSYIKINSGYGWDAHKH